ncbi:MAG: GTPase Era [Crocinitomicaceae bacterium]|nr:GTPase Era [Crocinitomicaceae bacterium]
MSYKSGFVNIIGYPNVGKSTLMNKFMGEKFSIITPKAQTTRHRIIGILNEPDYQIVFSDTPGIVKPSYKLHQQMLSYVDSSIQDADILLIVIDVSNDKEFDPNLVKKINHLEVPKMLLINKIDLLPQDQVEEKISKWKALFPNAEGLVISALHKFNTDVLLDRIKELLPENPPFYGTDDYTDRPMRFFISEIIREKILYHYAKEVPYSCEVIVDEYKDEGDLVRIRASIVVERDSQKGILIGHKGKKLKAVGIDSRKDMEKFIGKQVFLETFVKVDPDWRNSDQKLKKYGYQ